jgi:hypothetical protein
VAPTFPFIRIVAPAPSLVMGTNFMTVEAWVKTTNATAWNTIYAYDAGVGNNGYNLSLANHRIRTSLQNTPTMGQNQRDCTLGAVVDDGTWHHVAASFEITTTNVVNFYVDGALLQTSAYPAWGNVGYLNFPGIACIPWSGGPYYGFGGTIDELRISRVARRPSWMKTSFNNQNDRQFLALGPEEHLLPMGTVIKLR